MFVDILIGTIVFGYAGWTLYRHVKKSRQGACPSCSQNKSCSTSCQTYEQTLPKS